MLDRDGGLSGHHSVLRAAPSIRLLAGIVLMRFVSEYRV
jgi:hypothetical protein